MKISLFIILLIIHLSNSSIIFDTHGMRCEEESIQTTYKLVCKDKQKIMYSNYFESLPSDFDRILELNNYLLRYDLKPMLKERIDEIQERLSSIDTLIW